MLEVDFHSHTLFSHCGVHTVVEMLTAARERGLKALAITDHGPAIGGRVNSVFFDRLTDPVPGIRLLKGMECNLAEKRGEIDFPVKFLGFADVVLLGIHPNTKTGMGSKAYTSLLIDAMRKNPYVDIITHLNDPAYAVDNRRIAAEALRLGMALEINNSKTDLQRVGDPITESLISACLEEGCLVAVNSDAHTVNEVGDDSAVRPLLERHAFPSSLIVNSSARRALAWVEERRKVKRATGGGM